MQTVHFSNSLTKLPESEKTNDPINLFCQYYIDKNKKRQAEIIRCLQFNIDNPYVQYIYLLNERIYTLLELGLTNKTNINKIIQVNISKRIKYQDVFQYISENKITGYNVIANSDIFLDYSIERLRYSDIHMTKKMLALLRYEYNKENITQSKLFGPRCDSQDTWIIHSSQTIQKEHQKVFDFEFGKPGCDNKLIYLMNILGYEVINDPLTIQTFHYHNSQVRNYSSKDIIDKPYGLLIPANIHCTTYINNKEITFEDNNVLRNYIETNLKSGKTFIIPRIAGLENIFACMGDSMKNMKPSPNQKEYIDRTIQSMKNNTGIKLSSVGSIVKYSELYMNSFNNCETYFGWESYGTFIKHISNSYQYMTAKYSKPQMWTYALDIFHYIYSNPWTLALKGKKVLIVSAFEKSIKEKIPIREKIYGIDLFPDCELITVCPPQTQGTEPSDEFDVELNRFIEILKPLEYDIALVSCGGYGNLVCDAIYQQGKSAIYVGGVLQMYFGILGNRWIIERPDIVKLFFNEYWSRPKISERPNGHHMVENSCYW
jgi:hypothetical protein